MYQLARVPQPASRRALQKTPYAQLNGLAACRKTKYQSAFQCAQHSAVCEAYPETSMTGAKPRSNAASAS